MIVLFLIRDTSRERTGRTLMNQLVSSAVSALTTKAARRKENHLPALYQRLNQLLMMFPERHSQIPVGTQPDYCPPADADDRDPGAGRAFGVPQADPQHRRPRGHRQERCEAGLLLRSVTPKR
ncbi:p-hydroxybenzoic acid efflux pump subunit AaeB [Serratia fonticola]|uniref:p-hydroxybenzoic acid efflux pump subunit AaeB n=1 Tax=Serratia fonticola TaxID=47917 RepID=A0A4U9W9Q1_SERFO|nr:p-hydroxybenzoic acid efflux pump subunit AaeB [Serratia fonticola]